MTSEILNARIKTTSLGTEDHGIPTSYVTCEWQGSAQGFGGFTLKEWAMAAWVLGILNTLGLYDWSQVCGQYCRIRREGGQIVAIGHIVDDRWFSGDDLLKAEPI